MMTLGTNDLQFRWSGTRILGQERQRLRRVVEVGRIVVVVVAQKRLRGERRRWPRGRNNKYGRGSEKGKGGRGNEATFVN